MIRSKRVEQFTRNSPESESYRKMETPGNYESDLNLGATELRLGLPGSDEGFEKQPSAGARGNKRASMEMAGENRSKANSSSPEVANGDRGAAPPAKAQIVGWPPVQSYRKHSFQPKKTEAEGGGMYVKVSMDGAPYLRKIDIKVYKNYRELLKAFENMFKLSIGEYSEREGYNESEYAPTYEDKDGDWMLVGDVPWEMFISSCKRLRIMRGSEARGLGCV
ncbi:auxin-induced protein 22D-like [Malania oleifera]|uniref:auxin-induced protein 22D-like n=1 Tax=Malania oleifera TaxID=397392 RepID=UPI0025ADF2FC|nr:auxin-induced protein 22D-like [Malania oleifera]